MKGGSLSTIDERGRVEEGALHTQSSSQILLCNNLTKLHMGAKRGRPRKKKARGKKTPFDLGLGKGKLFKKKAEGDP